MNKIYAGVGSRNTPGPILRMMKDLAQKLAERGYMLRSGGAKGADTAFELGCTKVHGAKEIFYAKHATPQAIQLAKRYHPAWNKCNKYARKLHGRNVQIILGKDVKTPVQFVVCWTNGGGGTQLGIDVATAREIPVWNLIYPGHRSKLQLFLKRLEE